MVQTVEVDGKKVEERKYEGGKNWVSHKMTYKKNEGDKKQRDLFMSLFNYIAGKNETCKYKDFLKMGLKWTKNESHENKENWTKYRYKVEKVEDKKGQKRTKEEPKRT